jgi:hypothetical protein
MATLRRFTAEDAWIDEHLDLLQNIEAMIAGLYRDDSELEDWDVTEALSALITKFKAEVRGRDFRMPRLSERSARLFDALDQILTVRGAMIEEAETPADQLRALKEIRSSVRRHSKIHGQRGYLDFIIEFA